jgi:hypothetical protein
MNFSLTPLSLQPATIGESASGFQMRPFRMRNGFSVRPLNTIGMPPPSATAVLCHAAKGEGGD